MKDLKNMTDEELLEALSVYTAKYTRLINQGMRQTIEYIECRDLIKEIQEELNRRHGGKEVWFSRASSK